MRSSREGVRVMVWITLAASLGGCSTFPEWLSSSGPTREELVNPEKPIATPIRLLQVDDAATKRLLALDEQTLFSETLAPTPNPAYVVGPGDGLEVSVWEAPPAALFGSGGLDTRLTGTGSRMTTLPEQIVGADGAISVPFAGAIRAGGRSPQQIESDIAQRLRGKANEPQVMVRVTRNATANVTVVGEVAQSVRMVLTARGERLLDAIAAAGGVRQPVGKVTVQLTRGKQVVALPLHKVIRHPKENIPLSPGDVITVLFQPSSFTALGATGKNEEVPFEAHGISLVQALARAGGVQDSRADARGVFIFRFEDPRALRESDRIGPTLPDGKVPVVYRVDLKDPAAFLIAQNFPMRNKDVIYVSNAPSAELQKFLNILTSSIFSVASLVNLGR